LDLENKSKWKQFLAPALGFAATWGAAAAFLPLDKPWAILAASAVSVLVAFLLGRFSSKKGQKKSQDTKAADEQISKSAPSTESKKSYGPEIDPIIQEGNRALSEMGRLYMSIKDPEVRKKINEIMRITDKIMQDAIADPKDIPQIKKFMNYYLPTTIKLLNAYDRMSSLGIEGENLDKSMKSINEMLDASIVAYKKRLDALFENQALDIETDIEVMNTMLAREGLSGNKDFDI
jgi:5-bromo-4-chloroindolyl phosphate hydrolysis protein